MTKTTHKTSQSAPINKYRRGKISSDKTRSNAGARRIERKNNLELKNARRSSLRIGAGGLGLLGSGGGGFLALPLRRLVFALEQIRAQDRRRTRGHGWKRRIHRLLIRRRTRGHGWK